MNKSEILEVLNGWNFWTRTQTTGIERRGLLDALTRLNSGNFVISIIGPRRSGKSVLIKQFAASLINQGVAPRNILVVNFEDYRWQNLNLQILDKIYTAYLEKVSPPSDKMPYIFLDEVQKVPGWEGFARTLLEKKDAHIFVSGSSAKLLSRELATLLTGRSLILEVFPLDFREFLAFKNILIKDDLAVVSQKREIGALLEEYVEFGGFPEVALNRNKKEILIQYFEDVLEKDIAERHSVRRKDKLKALARFYLANVSNAITFRSVEKFLQIPLLTVERFSSFLEESYLLFFNKRFSFSLKEQSRSPRKVYSYDVGLANFSGFRFTKNTGRLYENIVAIELKRKASKNRNLEIFYGNISNDREVDFVVKEGLKVRQVIQVAVKIDDFKVKERETKPLCKFLEDLKLKEGLVITEDYEDEEKIKGKKIIYMPLWKWLLR